VRREGEGEGEGEGEAEAAHLEGPLEREARVAVGERGDLLLLEQRHLRGLEAEVVVGFEQPLDARRRVVGDHDREWQPTPPAALGLGVPLHREDVIDVDLQHGGACGDLGGQSELDAAEAEPLAQPARRHGEGHVRRLGQAALLVPRKLVRARRQVEAVVRHRRAPALQRVLTSHRLAQQVARRLDVRRQTTRVVCLQLSELRQHLPLLLVLLTRWRPALEEVRLAELYQRGCQLCVSCRGVRRQACKHVDVTWIHSFAGIHAGRPADRPR